MMFLYEKLSRKDLNNYKGYLEVSSVHPLSRTSFWSSWIDRTVWCLRFKLIRSRRKAKISRYKLSKITGLPLKDIVIFEDMNVTPEVRKIRNLDFIMKYAKGIGITELTININD